MQTQLYYGIKRGDIVAWIILVMALLLAVVLGYLYRFVSRILQTFGIDTSKKIVKWLQLGGFALFGGASLLSFGFGFVIAMYLVMFALLVQLANRCITAGTNPHRQKEHLVWNKVYGSGVIPILLTVTLLIGGYFQLHTVVQTDYTVYTSKNIGAEGYRVVLVADVHYGVSLDEKDLTAVCTRISNQNPDVVVLCGDIVDSDTSREEMEQVFACFGDINSNYGVYYVYGNHDRPDGGKRWDYTADELKQTIEANGITVLCDQVEMIAPDFALVGREDKSQESSTGRKEIGELLEDVPDNCFVLTLDHQPREYRQNTKAGTDLLLSGHTHAGQLFPLNLVQQLIPFNDGVYGQYQLDGESNAIVTSGLAAWNYPIRTAGPSEYVVIDVISK